MESKATSKSITAKVVTKLAARRASGWLNLYNHTKIVISRRGKVGLSSAHRMLSCSKNWLAAKFYSFARFESELHISLHKTWIEFKHPVTTPRYIHHSQLRGNLFKDLLPLFILVMDGIYIMTEPWLRGSEHIEHRLHLTMAILRDLEELHLMHDEAKAKRRYVNSATSTVVCTAAVLSTKSTLRVPSFRSQPLKPRSIASLCYVDNEAYSLEIIFSVAHSPWLQSWACKAALVRCSARVYMTRRLECKRNVRLEQAPVMSDVGTSK
ncbi:hypothetical protein CRG98_040950 [Punica granatum]|uniref:Uncharacterized protein n=1 Tax=Punica granatum TaxID=22663 RepID=A0A2I0I3V2_PUNGR|nr:hypothetical protein CRG98_040950 [Punica granatum]